MDEGACEPREKVSKMETDDRTEDFSENAGKFEKISGKLEYSLWVGRRKFKRKINEQYKNCTWIDVENQITAQLLATEQKLKVPMSFEMSFSPEKNTFKVESFFSNEKLGHDFFRHLSQSVQHFQ